MNTKTPSPARRRPVPGRRSRLLLIVLTLATVVVLAGTTGMRVMSDTEFTRFQDAGTLLTRADAADLAVVHRFDTSQADALTLSATAGEVVTSGKALFDGGLLNELAAARIALDTARGKNPALRPTRQPVRTPATPADAATAARAVTDAANALAQHTVATSRANAAITAAADTVRARVAAVTATVQQTVAGVTGHNPNASAETITALNQAADAARQDAGDPAGLIRVLAAAAAVTASNVAAESLTPPASASSDDGAPGPSPAAGSGSGSRAGNGSGGGAPAAGGGQTPPSGGAPVGGGSGGAPAPAGPPPESSNPEDHVQDANPQFRQIGCLDIVTYSQTTSYGGVVIVNVNYPYDRTVEKVGSDWKVTVYTCW
jgi:hypothetical protein